MDIQSSLSSANNSSSNANSCLSLTSLLQSPEGVSNSFKECLDYLLSYPNDPEESLLKCRQMTRHIYHMVRDSKRLITSARVNMELQAVEYASTSYEKQYYLTEINKCISTTYRYTQVLGKSIDDELAIEDLLNNELGQRKSMMEVKQELLARKESMLQGYEAKKKELEELVKQLGIMFEASKGLLTLVDEHDKNIFASPLNQHLLKGLKETFSKLLSNFEVRFFAEQTSTEDIADETKETRYKRYSDSEHVTIEVSHQCVLVFELLCGQRLVIMKLYFSEEMGIHTPDSWYLQLPLDQSLLLTIPTEDSNNPLALRWLNALAMTLPDPSFKGSECKTVLDCICQTLDFRSSILKKLSLDYKIDQTDSNILYFINRQGIEQTLCIKGTKCFIDGQEITTTTFEF